MTALCVDDEELLLDTLVWAVSNSPDIASVFPFSDELDALEWAKNNRPDIAFLDVRLHSVDGLALSEKLKEKYPDLPVVFCTGHREYAYDAFRVHAAGYLMKPIKPADVQREIDFIKSKKAVRKKLQARCFGTFEIYKDGVPLHFKRSKTKELLAYLIDRRGGAVKARELCENLWSETDGDFRKQSDYLHQLFSDLRRTLTEADAADVLETVTGEYSVNAALIDCDYFAALDGNEVAIRQFSGEYMTRYSWAEYTCSVLISKFM